MLSSKEPKCGIASYTQDFNKPLSKLVELDYQAFPRMNDFSEWEKLAVRLNREADLVHIQYHPQFCGYWRIPALAQTFYDFLKSLKIPSVITVHDLLDQDFFEPRGNIIKTFTQRKFLTFFLHHIPYGIFLRGGFLKAGSHLIAHWKKTESGLLQLGIHAEKISVFYPGIPEPVKMEKMNGRFESFFKNSRVIGMLGFLRQDKGYEWMLRVLKDLPEDVCLLALGEPAGGNEKYLSFLESKAQELGVKNRFIVSGYLPDQEAMPILSRCRLIVLPYDYRHHTASYALSCAMSLKRPILASDMEYFHEIKSICPSLYTYDRKSLPTLSSAVAELLQKNEAPDFDQDPFYQNWTWVKIAEKTFEIYQSLVGSKAGK